MNYCFLYKCRLCGGIERCFGTSDQPEAHRVLAVLINAGNRWSTKGIALAMTSVHQCKPSHLGISDLIGAEPEEIAQ